LLHGRARFGGDRPLRLLGARGQGRKHHPRSECRQANSKRSSQSHLTPVYYVGSQNALMRWPRPAGSTRRR
jgi:hypothetical protein